VEHQRELPPPEILIRQHEGSRTSLRPLFELAEDSVTALDSYISERQVIVAVASDGVVGHLQLTATIDPSVREVKNMAVDEAAQGYGVGSALVRAALELSRDAGALRVVVATAAADIDNLRFYQRRGFRLLEVERDAFTARTGYPPGLLIDGIELRDRVWLDQLV